MTSEFAEYHALLIGVVNYRHPGRWAVNGEGFDLPGAHEDVRRLARALRRIGYPEPTVLAGDVTADSVWAALEEVRKLKAKVLLVYWAGHGWMHEKEPALLCSDADPYRLHATSLLTSRLIELLAKVRAERVALFLDTCFSASPMSWDRSETHIRPVWMFGGASFDLAIEHNQRGVLTTCLIQALTDTGHEPLCNPAGIVPSARLSGHLASAVPYFAKSAWERAGGLGPTPQTPCIREEPKLAVPLGLNLRRHIEHLGLLDGLPAPVRLLASRALATAWPRSESP